MDNPQTGGRREVQVGDVNKTLQITGVPGYVLQTGEAADVINDSRAAASDGYATVVRRLSEVELGIGFPEWRSHRWQLVQQTALELTRLNLVLLACQSVHYDHANPGRANAI